MKIFNQRFIPFTQKSNLETRYIAIVFFLRFVNRLCIIHLKLKYDCLYFNSNVILLLKL